MLLKTREQQFRQTYHNFFSNFFPKKFCRIRTTEKHFLQRCYFFLPEVRDFFTQGPKNQFLKTFERFAQPELFPWAHKCSFDSCTDVCHFKVKVRVVSVKIRKKMRNFPNFFLLERSYGRVEYSVPILQKFLRSMSARVLLSPKKD